MFPEITTSDTVIGKGMHIPERAVIKNGYPALVPLFINDLFEWWLLLGPEAPGFIVGGCKG